MLIMIWSLQTTSSTVQYNGQESCQHGFASTAAKIGINIFPIVATIKWNVGHCVFCVLLKLWPLQMSRRTKCTVPVTFTIHYVEKQTMFSVTPLACTAYSDWGPYSDHKIPNKVLTLFALKPIFTSFPVPSREMNTFCHLCVVMHGLLDSCTSRFDDNTWSPSSAQQRKTRTWGKAETCYTRQFNSSKPGRASQSAADADKKLRKLR